MKRLAGLDSIRFICALWVVFAHLGKFPLTEGLDVSTTLGWIINSLYNISVNGRGAVMAFFVISGLCIHYPYSQGEKPDWRFYYPRRYLRIGIPLLTVLGLAQLFGAKHSLFLDRTILWSLLAELVYYTLYPALLMAGRRWGWKQTITGAFIAAYGFMLIVDPLPTRYTFYGPGFTWLIGLPCWLLGCLLAEKVGALAQRPYTGVIWYWRGAVWLASSLILYGQTRFPWMEAYTMNFYGILVYFWLQREFLYYQTRQPCQWLEKAGKFSYSLYLIHPLVFLSYPEVGYVLNWTLRIGAAVFLAYVFYLLVERPAHQLAQRFKPVLPATAGASVVIPISAPLRQVE